MKPPDLYLALMFSDSARSNVLNVLGRKGEGHSNLSSNLQMTLPRSRTFSLYTAVVLNVENSCSCTGSIHLTKVKVQRLHFCIYHWQ